MAVQAQYPSNNLLLFTRNGKEMSNNMLGIGINNYKLLQPQQQPPPVNAAAGSTPATTTTTTATGTFLVDQSHHYFPSDNNNNGARGVLNHHHHNTNPRKRGREEGATTTTSTAAAAAAKNSNNNNNNNPFTFSLQHHHQQHYNHQLMQHLSQLHHHHHNHSPAAAVDVSTGLKLSFGEHQVQQQNRQQHNNNNSNNHPNSLSSSSTVLIPSLFSDDELASHLNKQSSDDIDEINHFIHLQAEHLRQTISQNRQRHYRTLLTSPPDTTTSSSSSSHIINIQRLQSKQTELQKATKRHAELESRAAQLRAESQLWQAKARAQEAEAVSLQAQIEQAAAAIGGKEVEGRRIVDDDGCDDAAEDCESAYVDPDRVVEMSPAAVRVCCRACKVRSATVVVLPCRHMCLCVECDGVVQACPVCFGIRNSSVEVYLT